MSYFTETEYSYSEVVEDCSSMFLAAEYSGNKKFGLVLGGIGRYVQEQRRRGRRGPFLCDGGRRRSTLASILIPSVVIQRETMSPMLFRNVYVSEFF